MKNPFTNHTYYDGRSTKKVTDSKGNVVGFLLLCKSIVKKNDQQSWSFEFKFIHTDKQYTLPETLKVCVGIKNNDKTIEVLPLTLTKKDTDTWGVEWFIPVKFEHTGDATVIANKPIKFAINFGYIETEAAATSHDLIKPVMMLLLQLMDFDCGHKGTFSHLLYEMMDTGVITPELVRDALNDHRTKTLQTLEKRMLTLVFEEGLKHRGDTRLIDDFYNDAVFIPYTIPDKTI